MYLYAGTDPEILKQAFRGPLLGRIDLHVEVPPVRIEDIEWAEPGERSGKIKKHVNAPRRYRTSTLPTA